MFQYLSEANDIELWITEKQHIVGSKDFGKDENAADKMMTKQKALEADMTAYDTMVKDLHGKSKKIAENDPDNKKEVEEKQVCN